jgi:hypothetical protein
LLRPAPDGDLAAWRDKSEGAAWNAWYEKAVPEADGLYDVYLAELRKEGLLP